MITKCYVLLKNIVQNWAFDKCLTKVRWQPRFPGVIWPASMQIDRFPCKFDSYSIGINFGGWWPLQHHGKLGICANEDKRTRFNAFWYLSLYPPSNMAPIRGWWALYPESYTLRDGLIGKKIPYLQWNGHKK